MNSSKQSNSKKINIMSDAQNPYELEVDPPEESIQVMNDGIEFDREINQKNSPNLAATIRGLKVELQNCRGNNERIVKAQEEQNQLIAAILQSLTDLQGKVNSHHQRDVKLGQRKKGFKPSHFQDQQRNPSQAMTKPARMMGDKPRKPLQCWGCGGDHLIKYFPHRNGNERQVHNM